MLHQSWKWAQNLSPDLWIFRLEEATSSFPAEKNAHRLITHQMCWFSGTGGDRPLDQQAISLPSGRITHNWTGCMQKWNIPPFQVVSTGFSAHCSLLLSFSLLLCPHIFFVCPTGNKLLFLYSHLSFSCCFLVLTDRFESLLNITVFLSLSLLLAHSAVSWQRYGSYGSLLATHDSSKSDDLVSQQAWPVEAKWWSLFNTKFQNSNFFCGKLWSSLYTTVM